MQEAPLARCFIKTLQGVVRKPGPTPKVTVNKVSSDDIAHPVQKLVASSVDETVYATFNNKLEHAMISYFDKRIESFMNSKFGSLTTDLLFTSVVSTSQAPVHHIFSKTDGATM